MKYFFKILFYLLGSLLSLLLLVLLLVILLFNPNDYKPQIVELVRSQTNRNLTINGDIKLSLFPLGLKVSAVNLSNLSDFSEPTFAKVDNIYVQVKLLPLLHKRVEVDTLHIEGLALSLLRDAEGYANWQDLLILAKQDKTDSQSSEESMQVAFEGLNLKKAKIIWDDRLSKTHYELSNIDLQISDLTSNQPIAVKLATDVQSDTGTTLKGRVTMETQVAINAEKQQYHVNPLQLIIQLQDGSTDKQTIRLDTTVQADLKQQTLTLDKFKIQALQEIQIEGDLHVVHLLSNPMISGKLSLAELNPQKLLKQFNFSNSKVNKLKTVSLTMQFKGNVPEGLNIQNLRLQVDTHHLDIPETTLNLAQHTLTLQNVTLNIFDLTAKSQMKIKNIFQVPYLQGELTVEEFNLREWLQRIELPIFTTADPNSLTAIALEAQVAGELTKLGLEDIKLQVDNQQLQGLIKFGNAKSSAVNFDLRADKLDLDRYLPPPSSDQKKSKFTLPALAPLHELNVQGKLQIAELKLLNIIMKDISFLVSSNQGDLQIDPQIRLQDKLRLGLKKWYLSSKTFQ